MTVVLLDRLWINRLDSGDSIACRHNPDKSETSSMDGAVRTFASGRRRAITVKGEVGTVPFTLVDASLTTKQELETWKGIGVQVRDYLGQKWFGLFFEVNSAPYRGNTGLWRCSFTLNTFTWTEGV